MLDKLFNPSPTIHKWDRFWVGFIPGMICPLLVFLFFYLIKYSNLSFPEYLNLVKNPTVLSPMLSLGAIINLFLFFPLMSFNYFNAGRGVIGATILYGIPIIITKFIL